VIKSGHVLPPLRTTSPRDRRAQDIQALVNCRRSQAYGRLHSAFAGPTTAVESARVPASPDRHVQVVVEVGLGRVGVWFPTRSRSAQPWEWWVLPAWFADYQAAAADTASIPWRWLPSPWRRRRRLPSPWRRRRRLPSPWRRRRRLPSPRARCGSRADPRADASARANPRAARATGAVPLRAVPVP
jgi:hypothetical protein